LLVTLTVDVEDFITAGADDAARDVASVIASEGIQATMCVVGEKARRLLSNGRQDVIEAIGLHDVGLHTDTHSLHPTTLEALEGLGWDEGVEVIIKREEPGVEAIRRVFDCEPSCWGGAGNTWGPQVCGALQQLGVPAYVYAHTAPPGHDLHRFCGVTAYGGGLYLGDATLHLEAQWQERLEALVAALLERQAAGAQWCEVFVCHPCQLLCEEFWDGVNFAHGAGPPEERWLPAKRKPKEQYRKALAHLQTSLRVLRGLPGLRMATIRQVNSLLSDAKETRLTKRERQQAEERIRGRLEGMARWPIHRPNLDVSSAVQLTLERLETLRKLRLAEEPIRWG
jgi:hypothetical protein